MAKTKLKVVKAENVQRKIPIAYGGTVDAPLKKPIHATAWKQEDGVVLFATARGPYFEEPNSTQVLVHYDPVKAGATNLRWCNGCEEPHLRFIRACAGNNAKCGAKDKGYATKTRLAQYDGKTAEQRRIEREAAAQEAREADIAARIDQIMERKPVSREQQIGAVLRNIAASDLYPTPEAKAKRFAAVAEQYGLTVEQATGLVA